MDWNKKLDGDYLAMVELTREIGSLVEKSVNCGNTELTPLDIEHILKMTSDVTLGVKSKSPELTV
ncbi:MAG: hypothetical protein HRO68_05610 [Nitrosopumilus sp.]|nr:hypothetical protein [Nitrosopumilus sp.]